MSVTVRIPGALRKLAGGQVELAAEGTTVRELLDDLGGENPDLVARMLGEDGEIQQFLNLFVNGTDIRYEDNLDTAVSSGDEISIVPSIAGGGPGSG